MVAVVCDKTKYQGFIQHQFLQIKIIHKRMFGRSNNNFYYNPPSVKTGAGFIMLYSVIILGAIGLALVAVLAMSSIWTIRNSGEDKNSAQARKAADSCVELALQSMHDNNSFTGSGNSSVGGATCTYLVTNTGGNNRTINATGTIGSLLRKVSVSTSAFSPSIQVPTWQEVP